MATNFLEKTRSYLEEGEYDKARIILKRALDGNPNLPMALELSGDLAMKLGKIDEAIAHYKRAIDIYTQNKQHTNAIICYEKIMSIDKTKSKVLPRLADLYKSAGLHNEAIKRNLEFCSWAIDNKEETHLISGLKQILEMQPNNLSLRLAFVKILLSINRSQEAEDELNNIQSLAEEANDEEIIDEIKKLLPQYDGGEEELDPKSRIELGKLLYEIGSKDEAIVEFHKAVNDLLEEGNKEEAINVLNRIIEIDPNNEEATKKIAGLREIKEKPEEVAVEEEKPEEILVKEEKPSAEKVAEDLVLEEVVEEKPPEVEQPEPMVEEKIEKGTEEGVEFLQELSKEVEGFVAATESKGPTSGQPEDLPILEGQISDIENLLKEAEELPITPTFELTQVFDDFQNNIVWEAEDKKRMLELAKLAFDAKLYETTLKYTKDIKDDKEIWPLSLELTGSSLVKIGRYNEAIEILKPAISFKEIPKAEKIGLHYIFSSAYQGLGDLENALKEIEHVMDINPNYKDAKSIYELLGGKKTYAEPSKVLKKEVLTTPRITPAEPLKVPPKGPSEIDEGYPTIEEPPPEQKEPEKLPEEIMEIEEEGEKISFL